MPNELNNIANKTEKAFRSVGSTIEDKSNNAIKTKIRC